MKQKFCLLNINVFVHKVVDSETAIFFLTQYGALTTPVPTEGKPTLPRVA